MFLSEDCSSKRGGGFLPGELSGELVEGDFKDNVSVKSCFNSYSPSVCV